MFRLFPQRATFHLVPSVVHHDPVPHGAFHGAGVLGGLGRTVVRWDGTFTTAHAQGESEAWWLWMTHQKDPKSRSTRRRVEIFVWDCREVFFFWCLNNISSWAGFVYPTIWSWSGHQECGRDKFWDHRWGFEEHSQLERAGGKYWSKVSKMESGMESSRWWRSHLAIWISGDASENWSEQGLFQSSECLQKTSFHATWWCSHFCKPVECCDAICTHLRVQRFQPTFGNGDLHDSKPFIFQTLSQKCGWKASSYWDSFHFRYFLAVMLLWVRVKALKQIQTKPQHFGQLPNLHCIIYYLVPAKNPHVQIFGHKIIKPQPLASKICSWLVFAAPQELDFNWLGDGKSSSVKDMIATFSDLILALAARCRNFPGSS